MSGIIKEIFDRKSAWEVEHGRLASTVLIPPNRIGDFYNACCEAKATGTHLFGMRIRINVFRDIDIA